MGFAHVLVKKRDSDYSSFLFISVVDIHCYGAQVRLVDSGIKLDSKKSSCTISNFLKLCKKKR